MKIPAKYQDDYQVKSAFLNGVRQSLLMVIRIRAESAINLGTEQYMREMLSEIVGICADSETEVIDGDEPDMDDVAEDMIAQRQISEDGCE